MMCTEINLDLTVNTLITHTIASTNLTSDFEEHGGPAREDYAQRSYTKHG